MDILNFLKQGRAISKLSSPYLPTYLLTLLTVLTIYEFD